MKKLILILGVSLVASCGIRHTDSSQVAMNDSIRTAKLDSITEEWVELDFVDGGGRICYSGLICADSNERHTIDVRFKVEVSSRRHSIEVIRIDTLNYSYRFVSSTSYDNQGVVLSSMTLEELRAMSDRRYIVPNSNLYDALPTILQTYRERKKLLP